MRNLFTMNLVVILVLFCGTTVFGSTPITEVGQGTYSNELPINVSEPQSQIFRTPEVTGPMPTNDWWSSLAWMEFSGNLYAHPLAVNATYRGLQVGYPDAWVFDPSDGEAATPYSPDFVVTHSQVDEFKSALVADYSDWSVTARFVASGQEQMEATITQGSPFLYLEYANGGPVLDFFAEPEVWYREENVLGVTLNGHHYGFFAPSNQEWDNFSLKFADKGYLSIALLPDGELATLRRFAKSAFAFITDTNIFWEYDQEKSLVRTEYVVTTKPLEGTETATILALYPHQWRNVLEFRGEAGYTSARGKMKILEGNSFTTELAYYGILPFLPAVDSSKQAKLAEYVDEVNWDLYLIRPGLDRSRGGIDTYWIGKNLGRLAELIPVAEQAGDYETANYAREVMTERLERWFTATTEGGELARDSLFYYNDNWGTLIGYPANYGSDVDLNDHHFHYGYFIQAAAEVARRDRTWAQRENYGGMVDLLVRDIASPLRDDPMFPFLRNFSPYAGHSWASGVGWADTSDFQLGNNQESSSEAVNAWAAMILWGEATGRQEIRDLGIFLYTQEISAIHEYWFDVHKENFPEEWGYDYAAMVWGGGVKYNTWWTQAREEIHGINWMPYTGASLYLGWYPQYVQGNYDELVRNNPGTNWKNWEDLIYQWLVLADSEEALRQFNARVDRYNPEFGTTKANTYHWLTNIASLGTPDLTVTANTPLYAVLVKDGKRTYVAYNAQGKTEEVFFSDGVVLEVAPNSLGVTSK